jgi:hypothetical protein
LYWWQTPKKDDDLVQSKGRLSVQERLWQWFSKYFDDGGAVVAIAS